MGTHVGTLRNQPGRSKQALKVLFEKRSFPKASPYPLIFVKAFKPPN